MSVRLPERGWPIPARPFLPPLQAQLVQCKEYVENADWDTLRIILPRITGPPGSAKQSLYDAIALLEDRCARGWSACHDAEARRGAQPERSPVLAAQNKHCHIAAAPCAPPCRPQDPGRARGGRRRGLFGEPGQRG